jgi:hypothetical protein
MGKCREFNFPHCEDPSAQILGSTVRNRENVFPLKIGRGPKPEACLGPQSPGQARETLVRDFRAEKRSKNAKNVEIGCLRAESHANYAGGE